MDPAPIERNTSKRESYQVESSWCNLSSSSFCNLSFFSNLNLTSHGITPEFSHNTSDLKIKKSLHKIVNQMVKVGQISIFENVAVS